MAPTRGRSLRYRWAWGRCYLRKAGPVVGHQSLMSKIFHCIPARETMPRHTSEGYRNPWTQDQVQLDQAELRQLVEKVLEDNAELRRNLRQSKDSFDAISLATRPPDDDNATILRAVGYAESSITRHSASHRSFNGIENSVLRFTFKISYKDHESTREQHTSRSATDPSPAVCCASTRGPYSSDTV